MENAISGITVERQTIAKMASIEQKPTLDGDAVRYFLYLFAGTQGWSPRIDIVMLIREMPRNTNQLAEALGLDYKAVQHHLKVLEKNNMVTRQGEKYGVIYFVSQYLDSRFQEFLHVVNKLKTTSSRPKFDIKS